MPIESGGDAIIKLAYTANSGMPFRSLLNNHHTMRWGANLPGIAIHQIVGDRPSTYQVCTLIAFSLGFVLLTLASFHILNWKMVAPFALAMFMEPMMFRASTQFQPMVFGFVYVAATVLLAAEWCEHGNLRYLFGMMFFAFLPYGAHEAYVYFIPGFLAFIWLKSGKMEVLFALLVLAMLFCIEVLFFNLVSESELLLGRISALPRTHTPGATYGGSAYIDYFLMWTEISWFDQFISICALIPFWYYCIQRRLSSVPPMLILLSSMLTSYHLFNTFLIADFNTFHTSQPPFPKYLAITMPFACLATFGWGAFFDSMLSKKTIGLVLSASITIILISHTMLGIQPEYKHNGLRYPSKEA